MAFRFPNILRRYWVPAAIVFAGAAGALFAAYWSDISTIFSSIKANQSATALVASTVAILIALVNPSWQAHILGPRLRVEIATIEQKLDPDRAVVNLSGVPQYNQLNEIFSKLEAENFAINTDEPDDDRSKSEKPSEQKAREDSGRLEVKLEEFNTWRNDIKMRIAEIQEKLNNVTTDLGKFSEQEPKLEKSDIYEANRKYNLGLNIMPLWDNSISVTSDQAKPFIEKILSKCRKLFDVHQDALNRSKSLLQQLDYKYDEIEISIWKKKSLFYVSAIIINSGRNASAIKAPALLWIDLGSGHNVELELMIENFKEDLEVRAGSVRVATFKSPLIEDLPQHNREIYRYWN